jgi:leucyl-tRNA synthetase
MGWDAFGLPAENFAIKEWIHPRITTDKNIENFKRQIQSLWFSYDWEREIDTTDPEYFRWTQWIFLKLFEAGLAYEQDLPINYCPSCKTGLANEEVLGDFSCERCGTQVEKKKIRQWVLAITQYAERLLKDVDDLDWPEGIKDMQRNWIGRSEGCEFEMKVVSRQTPSTQPSPLKEKERATNRQQNAASLSSKGERIQEWGFFGELRWCLSGERIGEWGLPEELTEVLCELRLIWELFWENL